MSTTPLRDQLAELNAALSSEHQSSRPRVARPRRMSHEPNDEPRATHWHRIGVRDRLRLIAAALGATRT